jgi:hypothetical protein
MRVNIRRRHLGKGEWTKGSLGVRSMLTGLRHPELADFYRVLVEIRNCLGVTPTIR